MLPVQISRADFTDPRLAVFLQAHLDDMEPTAPSEGRQALDLTALQGDGVRLWVGADGDDLVATAALAALETGSMAFFEPARRFHTRAGFVACPPFGSYADDPNSTFMTLDLTED